MNPLCKGLWLRIAREALLQKQLDIVTFFKTFILSILTADMFKSLDVVISLDFKKKLFIHLFFLF